MEDNTSARGIEHIMLRMMCSYLLTTPRIQANSGSSRVKSRRRAGSDRRPQTEISSDRGADQAQTGDQAETTGRSTTPGNTLLITVRTGGSKVCCVPRTTPCTGPVPHSTRYIPSSRPQISSEWGYGGTWGPNIGVPNPSRIRSSPGIWYLYILTRARKKENFAFEESDLPS